MGALFSETTGFTYSHGFDSKLWGTIVKTLWIRKFDQQPVTTCCAGNILWRCMISIKSGHRRNWVRFFVGLWQGICAAPDTWKKLKVELYANSIFPWCMLLLEGSQANQGWPQSPQNSWSSTKIGGETSKTLPLRNRFYPYFSWFLLVCWCFVWNNGNYLRA